MIGQIRIFENDGVINGKSTQTEEGWSAEAREEIVEIK
jgi:hypothetical protein